MDHPILETNKKPSVCYAWSDDEFVQSTQQLATFSPEMLKPVLDNSLLMRGMTEHVPGRPAVRYLGLEAFNGLASAAGWQITTHLDGPMHHLVCLAKLD